MPPHVADAIAPAHPSPYTRTQTGYSIWEGAAAGGGSGGGHGGPLLEGDEDAEEEWFGEYDAAAVGGDGSSTCGGMLRYLHPPSASLGFCLPEGLPQDALVVLSALLTPAELMRLALASKALAARVGRGPGGAYPWLQKCLQAWDLPEGTALAQLSPDSRALDFAALYPDIVAWCVRVMDGGDPVDDFLVHELIRFLTQSNVNTNTQALGHRDGRPPPAPPLALHARAHPGPGPQRRVQGPPRQG